MEEFNNGEQQASVYGGQPQFSQNNPNMGQQPENKGFSIAALVCGIVSFIGCFINGLVAIVLSILAIVFGAIGKKKGAPGMAKAGMICGIINLVIYVLLFILIMVVGVAALGSLGSLGIIG